MVKKIIIIFLVIISFNIILNKDIYAAEIEEEKEPPTMDSIISDADSFIGAGTQSTIIETDLKDTSKYIYNILFSIAVVLAVAVGMILGIQFMIGSTEQQAKIKEALIPYVVGVFIIFSAFTIWKIAVNLGNKVTTQDGTLQVTLKVHCDQEDELYEASFSQVEYFEGKAKCPKCRQTIQEEDGIHTIYN